LEEVIDVVEPRLWTGKWDEGRRLKPKKAQATSMAKPSITFR
jgi:hypothetical protein